MKLKLIIGISTVVVLFAVIGFLMDISYDNQHERYVADIEVQEKKIESNYDKMFKTIAQEAQVTSNYFGEFKEIYKGIMGGRYGDGGSKAMWQWLKESDTKPSPELHLKLMNTIEASRASFDREQQKLAMLAGEDKKLFTTKPAKWFTSGEPREVTIISSTRAKEVMKTGVDDDIDVFNKK